jgi:hypothetical protein
MILKSIMPKSLRLLFTLSMLCLLSLSSCDKDNLGIDPNDSVSTNPIINQLRGNWSCNYIEENIYTNDTGKLIGTTKGEYDDVFVFASTFYQKRSSPYRNFVYGASRGSNGNIFLHLEEYDKHYTLEVTTLNATTMVWKLTFQGNNAKAIKYMYFKK